MRYADKKAVVIGGTHGMGMAAVRLLIDGGAAVLLTGNNERNVEAARRELGQSAHVARSNIADMAEIDRLAKEVARIFGEVDFVFINAGIGAFEPFEGVTEATFDRFYAINTKGAFFTAQRLAPLVRPGGSFVFTTVTPGTGTAGLSVYSGTKGALKAVARVLAAELLPRGIRVNMVAPGFISTPTLGIAEATPEERAAIEKIGDEVTPMKRHGTAEEVARAALFLAFEATYTTGAELPVDGGLSQVDAPR